MIFFIIATLLVILDQVTKFLVRASLVLGGTMVLVPGWVDVTYVQNTGAAFSAFPNATMPTLLAFPRRAYVLASPDALSIPLISRLVQMLGAMPVPDTLAGHRPFLRALETRAAEGALIAVYPEAHIWPYYTGVRPFSDASFAYPVHFGCPVVACAVTYRRRLLPFLPPALTLTLSDPILPNPDAAPGEERRRLRDQVYRFLCQQAKRNQVRYYDYVQAG